MCDDGFTEMAAFAICWNMNYTRANMWTSTIPYIDDGGYYSRKLTQLRSKYEMAITDVHCNTPNWSECTYKPLNTSTQDCLPIKSVFLSCQEERPRNEDKRKFLSFFTIDLDSIS